MKWLEASAKVDGEGAEAASQLLERFAYGGVAIEQLPTNNSAPRITVRAYLPADSVTPETTRSLREAWWHLSQARPMGVLRLRVVDEAEWADAWKRFFGVQRVGRRIVIQPSWREYQPQPDDAIIELDPGAAFGTGAHPSTTLCLEALEDLVTSGTKVLDVGTGSGILAIAAGRLGAGKVLGVDTDPIAVRVANENVALNRLSHTITIVEGTASKGEFGAYDIVVANIIANVLINLAEALHGALQPGGRLITSGIIRGRVAEVRQALAATGFKKISSRRSGAWYALLATKPE
jgi:ribosomal protein L11 methyltransferase